MSGNLPLVFRFVCNSCKDHIQIWVECTTILFEKVLMQVSISLIESSFVENRRRKKQVEFGSALE